MAPVDRSGRGAGGSPMTAERDDFPHLSDQLVDCLRGLKEIDFELAYLALLTREGLKPMSRWEKPPSGNEREPLARMGLITSQVRRTVRTGGNRSSRRSFPFRRATWRLMSVDLQTGRLTNPPRPSDGRDFFSATRPAASNGMWSSRTPPAISRRTPAGSCSTGPAKTVGSPRTGAPLSGGLHNYRTHSLSVCRTHGTGPPASKSLMEPAHAR